MTHSLTVALAGNPNCGKTALFNALTGSRQRVGNWPGVTVDKKLGTFRYENESATVVDLPGTYSSSVVGETSIDEKIACEYLLSGEADLIVNVIDASNLERNLYLTLQLLEVGIPLVLAVNMLDVVQQRGLAIDLKKLSKRLGCPVVGLVANRGVGVDELKAMIIRTESASARQLKYPPLILHSRDKISALIQEIPSLASSLEKTNVLGDWLALRLLEDDVFAKQQCSQAVVDQAQVEIESITTALNDEPDIIIADARYVLAKEITDSAIEIRKTKKQHATQWIDKIVLNKYLGIPIFFFIMYLMFVFAINVGGAFQDFFDISSDTIFISGLAHLLMSWHFPMWLIALLANGIGKGINTVVTFSPIIGGMFLFLAFLEDCGYMARASFVMDRFMCAIGLPGKSFVPMIVGFGCNVPAVMGARTLGNRRDRILTVMMMPFMSCGARLAIFAVFASAFFPQGGQNIIFLLYVVGIAVAVLTGVLLRQTMLKGKPAPLVMELPAYHMPQMGAVFRHAWQRLKGFLIRAGKYIVPICVLIGALNAFTLDGKLVQNGSQRSLLSATGRVITPIFAPMGIQQNNWPATVGLATGILAKEVVVGTLNTLYSDVANLKTQADQFNLEKGLKAALVSIPNNLSQIGSAFANPLVADEAPHDMNHTAFGMMEKSFDGKVGAFAYLLFVLLYFPCVSTMAAMRREVGRGWTNFSVFWNTASAYCLSVLVYQGLTWARHPLSSFLWCLFSLVFLGASILSMRWYANHEPKVMRPDLSGLDDKEAAHVTRH